MIPGENLIITVTVTDAGGREESATVETNSLFASIDDAGDASNPARVAYVRMARHLQNLSVLFSGVNSTSRDRILITDASLQDSFNWNESGHAPALRSIENDDLKLFDGNFYTIKNLEIASDVTGKVGMFAEPPALTDDLGNPVPVEILQLTLDHVTVDAPGNASDIGVLVGSVPANGQALIRDCKIDTVHFPAAATSLDGVSIDVRQMEINAKGRDSFAGGVIGDGSAFFAAARAEAKWKDKPYDVTLKDAGGNALFPYKTVDQLDGGDTRNEVKYHTGDWTVPEPISVTPSEITGDFGLIYYEWIEGDPNIYFEGYTCERKDPTAGYTLGNMVYHYVSSAGNDESLRGSVFVMEHGKYIKQDGYLLVEKNDLTDLNPASLKVGYAGRNEFNNGATNGYWMQESHLLTDAFVTGFIYRIRTSAIWSVPVRARFGMFISPVQRSHS